MTKREDREKEREKERKRKETKMTLSNIGRVCMDTILEGSDLLIEENGQKSQRR